MTVSKKALVDVIGTILFLLPINIFLLLISWDYVSDSWGQLESSPEAGGLPLVFALKTLILLFCFFMTLQGFSEIAKNIGKIRTVSTN